MRLSLIIVQPNVKSPSIICVRLLKSPSKCSTISSRLLKSPSKCGITFNQWLILGIAFFVNLWCLMLRKFYLWLDFCGSFVICFGPLVITFVIICGHLWAVVFGLPMLGTQFQMKNSICGTNLLMKMLIKNKHNPYTWSAFYTWMYI